MASISFELQNLHSLHFKNSLAEATSEHDEICVFQKETGALHGAHISIVLPHKSSKLSNTPVAAKSCRAFAYPTSTSEQGKKKISSLDFNMLTVGCLEALTGRYWQKLTFLLGIGNSVQTVPLFRCTHGPHGRYCITSESRGGSMVHRHREPPAGPHFPCSVTNTHPRTPALAHDLKSSLGVWDCF